MIGGNNRYIFGEKYILNSYSFDEAIKKINEDLKRYGDENLYYKEKTPWLEYRLLFTIQYVEHNTTELISKLAKAGKIEKVYYETLKKSKELDEKRKGTNRAFSPYAFSILYGYSLGKLIKIIEDKTVEFDDKKAILEKLNKFNKYRIDFIHKSFSNSKDMNTIIEEGIKNGKEVLEII